MPLPLLLLLRDWRVWAALGIVAAALWLRADGARSNEQRWQQKVAEQDAKFRAEETRRQTEQEKAREQNKKDVAAARVDARRAAAAADGLRKQLACARDPACNPAPGTGSEAANTLGDLLGYCDAEYRAMAKEADASRTAGQLCERSYDALTDSPTRAGLRANLRLNLKGTKP